ncbi:hypothetical protein HII17_11385 [Thalassotalea sp. M1531]|uniref:Uncharacterized protein n=1 Tax=Thalassotalea algicola TaxID=2716224 RepID=A0A7Y0LCR5_9GAMM|nr:hypothetical protein [Thalassotalea algicola]NMP32173.1 hypothetical protein [Thalassotalea algicola]
MAHDDDKALSNINEELNNEDGTLAKQLADAQKEIADLKMQIMWMERSYE